MQHNWGVSDIASFARWRLGNRVTNLSIKAVAVGSRSRAISFLKSKTDLLAYLGM